MAALLVALLAALPAYQKRGLEKVVQGLSDMISMLPGRGIVRVTFMST